MELVLHELSQFMAGDRWLVELLCQAYIPIDETFWAIVPPEDVQLLPRIREMLGEKLEFASSKNVTLSMQKSGKECFMKWSSRYMIPYWNTWTDPISL